MKIKLDENIPSSLKDTLAAAGHDCDTAVDEGLAGKDDAVVWNIAKQDRRFLITQDLDFSDIRSFAPGSHPGILLIRLREPSRMQLVKRVCALFEQNQARSMCRLFCGCYRS
jgi:predicted nuclease of predicted toxin-antitoxin system